MVALTGRREAYYSDHRGTPQEFVSAVKWGFLYQGQYYSWQKKPRGSPALDLDPGTFVLFLQNHDQIANSGDGRRAHELGSPGKYRALTALTLLAPGTPMLFQGQEFAASAPFLYFADHGPELAQFVREGRRESLAQFPSLATPDVQKRLADPGLSSTFEACKLDFAERVAHASTYALHRDLLALRRGDAVLRNAQYRGAVDGFVLGHSAFGIRLFGGEAGDRLLLVNLAEQLDLAFIADPLFAPPAGSSWQRIWSSSVVVYGGEGTPDWEQERGVTLATESAIVLISNKS
jgi:maltooligosyltrehalose trehalohydrolase